LKRSTAIKTALEIAERVKKLNGIVGTPECEFTAYRVKRMWLFGSTVKGCEKPNDVDILIDGSECGLNQFANWKNKKSMNSFVKDRKTRSDRPFAKFRLGKTDKGFLKSCGIYVAVSSRTTALRSIRGSSKMVRFHEYKVDGNLAHPRIMLYPRNDFKTLIEEKV